MTRGDGLAARWDRFGEYHDGPVTDPTGPVSSAAGFHVARGGSWLNGTAEARVSTRDVDDCACDPDNGPGSHTGFRLARTKPSRRSMHDTCAVAVNHERYAEN